MRRARAALAVLAAGVMAIGCGAPAQVSGAPGAGASSAPDARTGEPGRTTSPGQPLLPVDGVACGAFSCVYHAGARGYFACTSAGAGTCFHFGAPCTPADTCLFDGADGRYKRCTSIVEGVCAAWGATCAPASGCWFNHGDGLHHRCEQAGNGVCSRWGGRCTP